MLGGSVATPAPLLPFLPFLSFLPFLQFLTNENKQFIGAAASS